MQPPDFESEIMWLRYAIGAGAAFIAALVYRVLTFASSSVRTTEQAIRSIERLSGEIKANTAQQEKNETAIHDLERKIDRMSDQIDFLSGRR